MKNYKKIFILTKSLRIELWLNFRKKNLLHFQFLKVYKCLYCNAYCAGAYGYAINIKMKRFKQLTNIWDNSVHG